MVTGYDGAFPAVLVRVGKAACFAADEFFSARLLFAAIDLR